MTGCSADYCTNSTEKGHRMCRFPTESKRRKIWIKNTNRHDWIPGSYAALCEVSFIQFCLLWLLQLNFMK